MTTSSDSDKEKGKRRKKDAGAEPPEVVVVSVTPSRPPAPAKPGPDEVWVTLLESSPWSSKTAPQGERAPPAALRSPSPSGDSVTIWNEPVWRTPERTEAPQAAPVEIEAPEPTVAEAPPAIDTRAALTSLADLVRSNETILSRQAVAAPPEDADIAPPQAVVEQVEPVGVQAPEPAEAEPPAIEMPEMEVRIQVDAVEMAPPVEELSPMQEDIEEQVAPVVEPDIAVVVEAEEPWVSEEQWVPEEASVPEEPSVIEPEEPVAAPAPAARIARPLKVRAPVPQHEVPVEDLLGGVIGLAGAAVSGVVSAAGGLVGGLVKGGRMLGSGLAAGTRRLSGSTGNCQSCADPDCGSDARNDRK